MKLEKYEQLVKKRGLEIIHRDNYKGCIILISDGFVQKHPEHDLPQYVTEWAFGREHNKLDVAQPIFHEHLNKRGFGFANKQAERKKDAISAAKEFIDKCSNIREYA